MKKSQMVIVVLIICSVMMTWAFVLVTLTANNQKYQSDANSSLVAYYAAESGAENAILKISTVETGKLIGDKIGDASYAYKVSDDQTTITSSGTKNKITRTIKVILGSPDLKGIRWPLSWQEIAPTATP